MVGTSTVSWRQRYQSLGSVDDINKMKTQIATYLTLGSVDDINKVKTQFGACTQNLEQSAKAKLDDLNAFEKMAKSFEAGRSVSTVLAIGVPLVLADNRNNTYEAWCNQNGVLTSCPQGSPAIGRVRVVMDPRVYGGDEGRFALCYYDEPIDMLSMITTKVDFVASNFLVADGKTNAVQITKGFSANDPGASWKIGVTGKTAGGDVIIRIWRQTSPCVHDGGVCKQRLHGAGTNGFQHSTQTRHVVGIQYRKQTLRGHEKHWCHGRRTSRLGSVLKLERTPCPTALWIGTCKCSCPVHKKQPFSFLFFCNALCDLHEQWTIAQNNVQIVGTVRLHRFKQSFQKALVLCNFEIPRKMDGVIHGTAIHLLAEVRFNITKHQNIAIHFIFYLLT